MGGIFNFMSANYSIQLRNPVDDSWGPEKISIKTYIQDDIQPHNHSFFELAYITGGVTRHTLGGNSGRLEKGNYFIVDIGSRHSYEGSEGLTLVNCLFLPEIIDDELSGCQSFGNLIHICLLRYYKLHSIKSSANQVFVDSNGRVLNLLTMMSQELEEKKVGYQEIVKNHLLEIVVITMRNIMDQVQTEIQTEITLKMIDYIHDHYQERIHLKAFCEQMHYSPPYISRKFKQETGFSVSAYLQKTRIEKSCELLAGSRLSVCYVAEAVGYSDTKSFNNLFRKLIHCSPREYRKRSMI